MLSEDERKKATPLGDLRIDTGLASQMVRVGDRAVVRGPYTELLGGRVATKALDNRASVAAMLGALGYLAGMKHEWDVFAVATVQEEVRLFGAVTSAYGVAPDIAVAIDVTFGATPGLSESETVPMDKGAAIAWGPNLHPGIVKRLREAGDTLEIPYVNEPIPGHSGTDAWAIQVHARGDSTGLTSIPVRYMHSPVEMVVVADIDRTPVCWRLLSAGSTRQCWRAAGGGVMMADLRDILEKLSNEIGPSAARGGRSVIKAEIEGLVDRMEVDALGNLIAFRPGIGPEPRLKVMVSAHMDEVGFMVLQVDKGGMLRFGGVGGVDGRMLIAKRVRSGTTVCRG